MNAPLSDAVRDALKSVTLDDKYRLSEGRAFMSGVQALVRLPMLQRTRDALQGLNTAGFISGYRGSPLGTYDQALWHAREHLAAHQVVFQPGVNEELGATAVWGSQQLDLYPERRRFDGVFGLWYGKGPGVDRCVDVFKHANMAGTARHGGVVAVAGDDHIAKSSTVAHQSDHIFKACGFPVFFPSSVQEILDLGLHAFALSRYAGLWSAIKTIQEVVESSTTVELSAHRVELKLPTDFEMPEGGLHIRWPDPPLVQEARLMNHKWYAALAYIRANRLNHNTIATPQDRLGLIASGKAYNDTRQALFELGLDDTDCQRLGIRLHKVAVVWPLEATATRDFARGLQEILVIEEKRQMIEYQLKEELYNWRPDVRPTVLGKFDERDGDTSGGEWSEPNPSANALLRAQADLNPSLIARALARRLQRLELGADLRERVQARVAMIEAKERALAPLQLASSDRMPFYCSGCPHNLSTKVPEGSRAVAGIGCHYMVLWMDRHTSTFTQMGGEGVTWVGQAPFTTESHVFANLGDGTYFHSGLLAIRQSIAAKVNITYKILFNDAVAMTGGQPVDGVLQVPEMTRELEAEGCARIVVLSDEPEKYNTLRDRLAPGVQVLPRQQLEEVQLKLRETPGCTVLIYDQTCATEKRRRRKRGLLEDPARHVLINEAVCEGCGDCSVKSNCLSVEPVETEFGRKRQINPNSCNKDESCLEGFCPSFITVEGQRRRKPQDPSRPDLQALPVQPLPQLPQATPAWGIVVAGIGGTGVITIGQILGMAAHLDGKQAITQDAAGLAQKGGSTWSHIQIADDPASLHTTKVGLLQADLVLACDPIVAADSQTLAVMRQGRTQVLLNLHTAPTAAFVTQPDWQFPSARCGDALRDAVGSEQLHSLDAQRLAVGLLGDAIATNALLLGCAWQRGLIPLSLASLERAIELNGVQSELNRQAFAWGRLAAHDLTAVEALVKPATQPIQWVTRPDVQQVLARRVSFLAAYQHRAWAQRYADFVAEVQAAETAVQGGTHRLPLTEAVANNLFKLMSYKDEYEVARLHTDPDFLARIEREFDGPVRLHHHLAPPGLSRHNARGEAIKRQFGPWVRPLFKCLAPLKRLRGTPFDPFGFSAERRTERELISGYEQRIRGLLPALNADRLALATQIARVPEGIRGFGHVKARNLAEAQALEARLMTQWAAATDGARPDAPPASPLKTA